MPRASEINERFNAVPLMAEQDLLADERLFCAEVRVVLAHLRDVTTDTDGYRVLRDDAPGHVERSISARANFPEFEIDIVTKNAAGHYKWFGSRRRAVVQSLGLYHATATKTTPARRAPLAARHVNSNALPQRVPPGKYTIQTAFTNVFSAAHQAGVTLSVSAKVLRDVVRCLYPRAFRQHVGSSRMRTWLPYVFTRVGLLLIFDSCPDNAGLLRLILGKWPWPLEPFEVRATHSCAWHAKDDAERVSTALRRARAEPASGPATPNHTSTSTSTSTCTSGVDALSAREMLRLSVCCAEDNVYRVANDGVSLWMLVWAYYGTPEVVLFFCHEMMQYLVVRAVCGHEQAPWASYPHILALVSALMGVTEAHDDGPHGARLSDKNLFIKLSMELAAQLLQRHDVYRHLDFSSVIKYVMEAIRVGVKRGDTGSIDERFCSPWCPSFHAFVAEHKDNYPGLLSFT